MKIYPFPTLRWVNKNENIAKQIFQAHTAICSSELLKISLLSETMVSQTQLAFICSNSAILTVK